MRSWSFLLIWNGTRRCPSWKRQSWELFDLVAGGVTHPLPLSAKPLYRNPADSSARNHARGDPDYSFWLINSKIYGVFLLFRTYSFFQFRFHSHRKILLEWQMPSKHPAEMVDPFAVNVSSFLYPLSFLKKTTCLLSLCFLTVRKPLKMLLLPCHSIMPFGGRISWSHGKENCCPGSFISYSAYDSQNCIVLSQRGKLVFHANHWSFSRLL